MFASDQISQEKRKLLGKAKKGVISFGNPDGASAGFPRCTVLMGGFVCWIFGYNVHCFDMTGLCVCGYLLADVHEHMHGRTSVCMAPTPHGQPPGRLAAIYTSRVFASRRAMYLHNNVNQGRHV